MDSYALGKDIQRILALLESRTCTGNCHGGSDAVAAPAVALDVLLAQFSDLAEIASLIDHSKPDLEAAAQKTREFKNRWNITEIKKRDFCCIVFDGTPGGDKYNISEYFKAQADLWCAKKAGNNSFTIDNGKC